MKSLSGDTMLRSWRRSTISREEPQSKREMVNLQLGIWWSSEHQIASSCCLLCVSFRWWSHLPPSLYLRPLWGYQSLSGSWVYIWWCPPVASVDRIEMSKAWRIRSEKREAYFIAREPLYGKDQKKTDVWLSKRLTKLCNFFLRLEKSEKVILHSNRKGHWNLYDTCNSLEEALSSCSLWDISS